MTGVDSLVGWAWSSALVFPFFGVAVEFCGMSYVSYGTFGYDSYCLYRVTRGWLGPSLLLYTLIARFHMYNGG